MFYEVDTVVNRNIPYPCIKEVEKYIRYWDSLDNYVLQEKSLDKLFCKLVPQNKEIEDILIKASTLNDFYSTNIFSIFPVAKHILELNIDERLGAGDTSLVEDIACVEISGKEKHFYSFASKYCSHHKPFLFPIYDNYVENVLLYFSKQDSFANFKRSDLRNYKTFKDVIIEFSKFYKVDTYNLKDLDRYLWQLGKEYFPKKY